MNIVNATEICALSLEKENRLKMQNYYDKKLATLFLETYILK